MSIVNVILSAAADIRLKSHIAIHTLSYLAHHADEHGTIGTNATGEPVGDPRVVAAALGYGKSSVYKAVGELADLGYVTWDRAQGYERKTGVKARVRIIASAQ